MDNTTPSAPQKKGLSPLAWIGIGCGGLVILGIIAVVAFAFWFAPRAKQMAADAAQFAQEAEKNPSRTAATMAVKVSFGQIELVAEDDVNKRYTVKEKQSGKLTTFYWDAKTNSPQTVEGDFSAIPASASATDDGHGEALTKPVEVPVK